MLAGVGAALMGIAPVKAADLGRPPVYRAPPPVALPFSWNGCYIGGNIGGGWGSETASAPTLAPGISVTGDTSGVIGGGQVGCNYQFAPNWLIGIEGDGFAADIKGDTTATILGITGTAHVQTDWIASVTGRLGWAVDRWLIYAKGGAAWAGDKYSADVPIFVEHIEANETRAGWTVGGGVEWAFSQNWSAKVVRFLRLRHARRDIHWDHIRCSRSSARDQRQTDDLDRKVRHQLPLWSYGRSVLIELRYSPGPLEEVDFRRLERSNPCS